MTEVWYTETDAGLLRWSRISLGDDKYMIDIKKVDKVDDDDDLR